MKAEIQLWVPMNIFLNLDMWANNFLFCSPPPIVEQNQTTKTRNPVPRTFEGIPFVLTIHTSPSTHHSRPGILLTSHTSTSTHRLRQESSVGLSFFQGAPFWGCVLSIKQRQTKQNTGKNKCSNCHFETHLKRSHKDNHPFWG